MDYEDILYEVRGAAAWITINRPERMNAFRGRTCDELIQAISELQAGRVPSSKPKGPKRLDEKKAPKDPSKRNWRDDLFGE